MVDQNEVRMKQIAVSPDGDLYGVDANGIVYFYEGADLRGGRWTPFRMRTDKGDE